MKQVQWFPGHMFKSLREIKEKIKLMDLVFILLDARVPFSSMNPSILELVGIKPTLVLFNKSDLADSKLLKPWFKKYEEEGFFTLAISSSSGKNVDKIYEKCLEILDEKIQRRKAKGLKVKPIRAMIIGIPNVGKSTLINQLTKSKATKTANTPGVTKSQQWIKINEQFELLDTPGVLWPKFDNPIVGLNLAATGAIKDAILPIDNVVNHTLRYLFDNYYLRLVRRYGITIKEYDYLTILDQIGKKRGALLRGNEIDYERVYQVILSDLRNGLLGELTLDRFTS